MPLQNNPLYDIKQNYFMHRIGKTNPELHDKIFKMGVDIQNKTHWAIGRRASMESALYLWLMSEKGYSLDDCKKIGLPGGEGESDPEKKAEAEKKKDAEVMKLFEEFYGAVNEAHEKGEFYSFLARIQKNARKKLGEYQYPDIEIDTLDDMAKVVETTRWMELVIIDMFQDVEDLKKNHPEEKKKYQDAYGGEDLEVEEQDIVIAAANTFYNERKPLCDPTKHTAVQGESFMNARRLYNEHIKGRKISSFTSEEYDTLPKLAGTKMNSPIAMVTTEKIGVQMEQDAMKLIYKGGYDPRFDNALRNKFADMTVEAVNKLENDGLNEFNESLKTAMSGLSTTRLLFTGKDSTEMAELKESLDVLMKSEMPTGGVGLDTNLEKAYNFQHGLVEYERKLYDTLNKAVSYKIAKDSDGKNPEDRSEMGYDRYMANEKLIKALIEQIKKVDAVSAPIYEAVGVKRELPELKVEKASKLIGLKNIKKKAMSRTGTAEGFYLDGITKNYARELKNKEFVGLEGVERALEIDKFLKQVSAGDTTASPEYRAFLEQPGALKKYPTIESERERKQNPPAPGKNSTRSTSELAREWIKARDKAIDRIILEEKEKDKKAQNLKKQIKTVGTILPELEKKELTNYEKNTIERIFKKIAGEIEKENKEQPNEGKVVDRTKAAFDNSKKASERFKAEIDEAMVRYENAVEDDLMIDVPSNDSDREVYFTMVRSYIEDNLNKTFDKLAYEEQLRANKALEYEAKLNIRAKEKVKTVINNIKKKNDLIDKGELKGKKIVIPEDPEEKKKFDKKVLQDVKRKLTLKDRDESRYNNAKGEADLEKAKKQAADNLKKAEADLKKKPVKRLNEAIKKEKLNRKADSNDKEGILNSAYKSMYYQVLENKLGKALGLTEKTASYGRFKAADINKAIENAEPEKKKEALSELSAGLDSLDANAEMFEKMKNTEFGRVFKEYVDKAGTKDITHVGILSLRDKALNTIMKREADNYVKNKTEMGNNVANPDMKTYEKFKNAAEKSKQVIIETEKLAKALGSNMTVAKFANIEFAANKNDKPSFEFKKAANNKVL